MRRGGVKLAAVAEPCPQFQRLSAFSPVRQCKTPAPEPQEADGDAGSSDLSTAEHQGSALHLLSTLPAAAAPFSSSCVAGQR